MANLTRPEAFAILQILQTVEFKFSTIEEVMLLSNAYQKLEAECKGNIVPEEPAPKPEEPKPAKKPIDKGKIVALRNAGWVVKDIADEMRCSTQLVYKVLNEAKQK